MTYFQNLRLLPVLVIVAGLSFSVRVGELFYGFSQGGTAYAQEEVEVEPPPLPSIADMGKTGKEDKEHAETAMSETGDHDEDDEAMPPPLPMAAMDEDEEDYEPVDWQDATDAGVDMSEVRAGLFKDLSKRRQELDEREKRMAVREALLEAAERELDQKLRELTSVKNEIEALLREQSEEEKQRLQSLVKIYEGMKAKDAARIFNTLDIDVLIRVMSLMSERKSAPILAEMSPERARSVTILLAQQKQLPTLPPQ